MTTMVAAQVVSYRGLFTAGWFDVREKYYSRLEIYDRFRASEHVDQLQQPHNPATWGDSDTYVSSATATALVLYFAAAFSRDEYNGDQTIQPGLVSPKNTLHSVVLKVWTSTLSIKYRLK